MPTNFTPLPTTVAHGKGAVNVNTILIIIALGITILLGALMWFLVVQKQQEENKANLPTSVVPQKTSTVTVETSITPLPSSPQTTATPSASPIVLPTAINPSATPSALPTSGSVPSPQAGQATLTP